MRSLQLQTRMWDVSEVTESATVAEYTRRRAMIERTFQLQ